MFNIYDSHSLGEIALKGLANTGAYFAKKGAAKAIKSDYAKKKIKNVANKYLDQALDSFTSDLSKKISPTGGAIKSNKPYCGINKVPTGRRRGDAKECLKQNQIRYYGIDKIDKSLLNERLYNNKIKQKKYQKLIKMLVDNKDNPKLF